MPANPTAQPQNPTAKKSPPKAIDSYQPPMPEIPGVNNRATPPSSEGTTAGSKLPVQIGVAAGALLAVLGLAAMLQRKGTPQTKTESQAAARSDESAAPTAAAATPVAVLEDGGSVAATVDELAKPWSAKKFAFAQQFTQASVDAMVMRLPSGELWAFALSGPYSRCELEYVPDLNVLAEQYRYHAVHPMVVSPCDGTIYDPLKVGPLGGDTWARGQIVQGNALRPPLAIEVRVSGRSVIADRME